MLRSSQSKVFVPWNRSLEKLIYKVAAQFHITIYDLALNWNHIHFIIMIKNRQDYVKFIRALTSILSQKIKLKFGKATEVFGLRPFTRILEWGRDFKNTLSYLLTNQLESVGLIKRLKPQKTSSKRRRNPLKPKMTTPEY